MGSCIAHCVSCVDPLVHRRMHTSAWGRPRGWASSFMNVSIYRWFWDKKKFTKLQNNVHKRLYFLGIQKYIFLKIFILISNFFEKKSNLSTAMPLANRMAPRKAAQQHGRTSCSGGLRGFRAASTDGQMTAMDALIDRCLKRDVDRVTNSKCGSWDSNFLFFCLS